MTEIPTSRRYYACPSCKGRGVKGRTLVGPVLQAYQWAPRTCHVCQGRGYLRVAQP